MLLHIALFHSFYGWVTFRWMYTPHLFIHSSIQWTIRLLPSFYFIFFSFIFISWRLITLQYCSGFCHTLTWISHRFTCIPHPDPPSHRFHLFILLDSRLLVFTWEIRDFLWSLCNNLGNLRIPLSLTQECVYPAKTFLTSVFYWKWPNKLSLSLVIMAVLTAS